MSSFDDYIKDVIDKEIKKSTDKAITEFVKEISLKLGNINENKDRVLLDEGEVAKLLDLSVHTLRIWRHKKIKLPYHNCGRSVRYRYADITEFIEKNAVKVK